MYLYLSISIKLYRFLFLSISVYFYRAIIVFRAKKRLVQAWTLSLWLYKCFWSGHAEGGGHVWIWIDKLCFLRSSGDCSWVSGGWLPCGAVLRWNPASCLPRRKRPADGKNGWRLVPWQQQQHCWYLRPVVPSAGLLKIQCERKSTAGIVGLAAVCAPSPGIFVDTCSYW